MRNVKRHLRLLHIVVLLEGWMQWKKYETGYIMRVNVEGVKEEDA
jgi:hypothetical protein